jgi:hypothetical protein
LLVLKLFVSSHPLELWRCPMHLCFATPRGTSWIPLCYVFYMLETNNWLTMHYYSWSFVCVTFHVVTWLLSSMVRIMSLMPMFRVLWSQYAMLYLKLIDGAVLRHPVGNPKRKVWGAHQQVSLSCETKVYQTSRRKPNFRRWCLLASRHSGQRR